MHTHIGYEYEKKNLSFEQYFSMILTYFLNLFNFGMEGVGGIFAHKYIVYEYKFAKICYALYNIIL